MSVGLSRTPERATPLFSSVMLPVKTATAITLTTGGGVLTMTMAQVLSGLLICDTQDAQSLTTPSAAVLNAGIPGVAVGTSFDLDVINYGDSTLTIALGTGVTKPTTAGVSAVLTLATLVSKRFTFVCTGVAIPTQPGTSDAWTLYAFGSIAAAVA